MPDTPPTHTRQNDPRAAFTVGARVQRTFARDTVYTVTAWAWDRHYNAWDVTMTDDSGKQHGEFGHNLEFVSED